MAANYSNYRPLKARFDSFVQQPSDDGCWVWTGSKNRSGYGQFGINDRPYMAHRIAWMIYVGPLIDDIWVLHRCDNPMCVNPSHLFLGTVQDNVNDMICKGRARRMPSPKECPRGHEYTAENTYWSAPRKDGRKPTKGCRECARIRYRLKKYGESLAPLSREAPDNSA